MEHEKSGHWAVMERKVLFFREEINEKMHSKPYFKGLRTTNMPEYLPCILPFPGPTLAFLAESLGSRKDTKSRICYPRIIVIGGFPFSSLR